MTTRVTRMSPRRRKIAWRQFIVAETKKDLLKHIKEHGPIRYDAAGYEAVRGVIFGTLRRLGSTRPMLRGFMYELMKFFSTGDHCDH